MVPSVQPADDGRSNRISNPATMEITADRISQRRPLQSATPPLTSSEVMPWATRVMAMIMVSETRPSVG